MNRDRLFQALSGLDDRYIAEAIRYAPEDASGASERIVKMKAKRIITIALAAALILALGVTAWAVNAAVATPEAAEKVALEQIEKWKTMGLISQDVVFEGPADDIFETEERDGGEQDASDGAVALVHRVEMARLGAPRSEGALASARRAERARRRFWLAHRLHLRLARREGAQLPHGLNAASRKESISVRPFPCRGRRGVLTLQLIRGAKRVRPDCHSKETWRQQTE